jgi:hypothetical protein
MTAFDYNVFRNKVLWIHTRTTEDVSKVFVRIQEFYESQFDQIRGKHFTLNQLKKLYTEQQGWWSYYGDWGGFNVPGRVVRKFFKVFKDDLRPDERRVLKILEKNKMMDSDRFYIIGTVHKDRWTFDHELAHAFFYIYPKYRKQAKKIVAAFKKASEKHYEEIVATLKKWGYCDKVMVDEIHAYLATSCTMDLLGDFNMDHDNKFVLQLEALFIDTLKDKMGLEIELP